MAPDEGWIVMVPVKIHLFDAIKFTTGVKVLNETLKHFFAAYRDVFPRNLKPTSPIVSAIPPAVNIN